MFHQKIQKLMPKESYAHEDVILICTNSMKTSKLAVAERRVSIAKGKKVATEMDKPFNFMCKWMGVLMAALAGILCAIMAVPFLAALFIALIAGAVGAGLGGTAFCMIMLFSSVWNNPHSKVKIGNIKALTESATMTCNIGGGSIQMFFSPVMAAEQNRLNFTKNAIEIVGAALMGRAIPAIFTAIAGSSPVWGSAFFGYSCAVISQGAQLIGWAAIGYGMSEGANVIGNVVNDGLLNDEYGPLDRWDRGLGDGLPIVPFAGERVNEDGETVGYGYLQNEPSDKDKTTGQKAQEVFQTDYQKPFTEPLSIQDETKLNVDRKQNSASRQSSYDRFQKNETLNFKKDNSLNSYRKHPELNSKQFPKDLDKYEAQQKAEYKKNNPVHEYKNKNNKKLQGRQRYNQQKLNRRANQHAAAQRRTMVEQHHRMVMDKTQANYRRDYDASEHGKSQRQKMFNRDKANLERKYKNKNTATKIGAFAFFFVSDVLTKTWAKNLEDRLGKSDSPEAKARAGVKVVALERM